MKFANKKDNSYRHLLTIILRWILIPGLLVAALVSLIKGNLNSNNQISYQFEDRKTTYGGPFESSGSTSRYALTQAIVEDGTLFFDKDKAKFSSPDVSKHNGRYFTIFTPGVSFIGVPFYVLGRQFGLPQTFAYLSTIVFALFNIYLIFTIARKLGSGFYSSLLAGSLFLFGTNALSYATSYTQHLASTFVVLMGLLIALNRPTFIKNILLGMLYGAGLLIDVPNGILLLPVVLYILGGHIQISHEDNKTSLKVKVTLLGLIIGLAPLILAFGWYNYKISGSATFIPQFAGRTTDFSDNPEIDSSSRKDSGIRMPFNTRNIVQGSYLFLISNERSIIVYTPVVIFGVIGLIYLIQDSIKKKIARLILALFLVNLTTYTMFGDAWGGWAFGPRYLIPGLAVLSIGISCFIERFNKKPFIILLFSVISIYSIAVNVLGATTTSLVPPKVEAVAFPEPIPYTYLGNWERLVNENLNSSLIYNLYLKNKLTAKNFTLIYTSGILLLAATLYVASALEKRNKNEN